MAAERDVTRIVQSWLRTDEHESADRVLDNVLALLDATPQRRSWWPARRIADMNITAKLATAAAAVVVVALMGVLFLPRGTGVTSPGPTPTLPPSPSASPPPSASVEPSASVVARPFPADGPLAAGRHSIVRDGVSMSFELPSAGWNAGAGVFIQRGTSNGPEGASIVFWNRTNTNVYGDPCKKTPLSPAPALTAADLASAVTKVPRTEVVSGPADVTIDGFPAKHVVIKISDTLPCPPNEYYLWYERDPVNHYRYATALGMTYDVWIIDHQGTLLWIDGETYKGAPPARAQELQRIVDSIQFE